MNEIAYPRLLRRIQAVLIDSIIVPVTIMIFIMIINQIGQTETWIRIFAIILPVFILEPLMVSLTGGTIGHHFLKLRIRQANKNKNINILYAVARFIIKLTFGWISYFFILTTKRHQALHDKIVQSIVVHKSTEKLSDHEVLEERKPDEKHIYPSVWKRVIVIMAYIVAVFVFFTIAASFILTDQCINYGACNNESLTVNIMSIIFYSLIGTTIFFGWKGKLFGSRRKLKENA